jgi:D-alanine-D-alanine ligase
VIEIRPKHDFFTYEAKYTKGQTDYLVPAALDKNLESQVKALALRAHDCLGCRDISRVDLILSEDNEPLILEVNTVPGFTETSLLPKAAHAAGIELPEVCARLVQLAMARSGKRQMTGAVKKEAVAIS